ncbi:hypothetical protein CW714_03620 [Methanophagales archaeon]|nr:MAG: hypothetical protein CW714_03620 [Methanophagales archaeon]
MKHSKLSAEFIKSLIEDENPIHTVGNELVEIWLKASRENNNIGEFYYKGEEEAKSFEEFILKVYGEFYRILARECINEPSIFQKYGDASFIVMDGMSFREGVLVYNTLKSEGYETRLNFGFSAIPSETLEFRDKMGVSMSNFKEINNPENIRLGGDEKFLWSQFPDVMLDKIQVGRTVISSLEKMYETTAKIVEDLVDKLKSDKIIILSDHGYIRSEAGFVFTVGERAKRRLQDVFGSKRYIAMNDVEVKDLIRGGYVEEFGGYYLVKSRYIWPVRGRYSIYIHGGLSLMECFTPVIEVNKQ